MKENSLKFSTLPELADFLQVNQNLLFYLSRNLERFYQEDTIDKPDGRKRILLKPQGELKHIQKLIHKMWLKYIRVPDALHSYRKGRSNISNAAQHVGMPFVLTIDIKDFFPSVTEDKVFLAFKNIGCSDSVAGLLAVLTTYKNQLPQGASTSPVVANLVLIPLIYRISKLCSEHGFKFSQYADDITVSGSDRIFKIKNLLLKVIKEEGFEVNPQKIKKYTPRDKKKVTGVIVNLKTNIEKEYRRKVRAIINNILKKGVHSQFNGDLDQVRRSLIGKINYIRKLNPLHGLNLERQFNLIKWEV